MLCDRFQKFNILSVFLIELGVLIWPFDFILVSAFPTSPASLLHSGFPGNVVKIKCIPLLGFGEPVLLDEEMAPLQPIPSV